LLLPHNEETGAVREAPSLVGHVSISLERFFEKLAGLGNDDNFGGVAKREDSPCRCLPQMSPYSLKLFRNSTRTISLVTICLDV